MFLFQTLFDGEGQEIWGEEDLNARLLASFLEPHVPHPASNVAEEVEDTV